MRKVLIALVLGLAVLVLTGADTKSPVVVSPNEVAETQAAVPMQTQIDFAAWLQENAEGGMCRYEADAALSFNLDQALDPGRGQSCGGNTCGFFQYCCNPSCGICVFYGMSCTQQSCN